MVKEVEYESDEEATTQTEQKEGERQEEKPEKAEKIKEEKEGSDKEPKTTPKRRGQRSRNKPNYYGQDVMVTQLSPAREPEEEEEAKRQ